MLDCLRVWRLHKNVNKKFTQQPAECGPSEVEGLVQNSLVFLKSTVDGSEILHQFRLVVYPIIYKVSYIPGG